MAEIEFLPPPRSSSEALERVESPSATKPGDAPAPAASPTIFRALTQDEITREVLPDYAATGNPLPDPAISRVIGAVQGDKVIAYLVLQLKLHAQPLVIRPGHANVLQGLVHAAESHILATAGPQWVYLFTPAGKLTQLAQTMGMQLEPWCVMSKLVQPELPAKPALELVELPSPEDLERAYQAAWAGKGTPIEITAEELEQHPGVDYDDAAWEGLFPGGVMSVDPSTGRVQ